MTEEHGPTVRHRRLSNELRRLREAAGLDTLDVARSLNWDRSKVNRIERSQWKRLKEADIRSLCALYGLTDEGRIAALIAMSKQAKEQGWWVRYHDVLGPGSYVSLESQASTIRFFGALVIPGLLQTPAYARALIRDGGFTDPAEIKRRVEARMARQELLERPEGPTVRAIIDEAALRKLVGGTLTMREQLLHLMLFNEQGTAEVRLILDSVGGHPGVTGQFAILDFASAQQSTVVFIDISRDGIFMEEPEEIGRYEAKFDGLSSLALTPEETNVHLARIVDDLRGG